MAERTTALLPPAPVGGGGRLSGFEGEPLDYGPAFVVSGHPTARYCHRPRSGNRYEGGRLAFTMWCGAMLLSPIPLERPDVVFPVCGACEGRAVGAGFPSSTDLISGAVTFPVLPQRFTPRPHYDPPRWCPGSASEFYLATPTNWRRGTCMVCTAAVHLRQSGGFWTPRFGPQRHEPEHIIPPCRWHAWRYLTWIDPARHLVGCHCQLEPR